MNEATRDAAILIAGDVKGVERIIADDLVYPEPPPEKKETKEAEGSAPIEPPKPESPTEEKAAETKASNTVTASSSEPVTQVVSVGKGGPASDGWYARHARRTQDAAAKRGRRTEPPMVNQSVTRPQPVGRPGQIILDAGGPRSIYR